jgi:hypothetical protein
MARLPRCTSSFPQNSRRRPTESRNGPKIQIPAHFQWRHVNNLFG